MFSECLNSGTVKQTLLLLTVITLNTSRLMVGARTAKRTVPTYVILGDGGRGIQMACNHGDQLDLPGSKPNRRVLLCGGCGLRGCWK